MAIRFRHQAYMGVFTQHLNSIVRWLWLTILDNLGAGFTASCQASNRTFDKLMPQEVIFRESLRKHLSSGFLAEELNRLRTAERFVLHSHAERGNDERACVSVGAAAMVRIAYPT
ncbi:MAG TPA: hypothetical protein DCZ48_10985 [Methylococcaceae bacterium]|nr:hypothetical protein [Methylococcaceae bacterium]